MGGPEGRFLTAGGTQVNGLQSEWSFVFSVSLLSVPKADPENMRTL